MNDSTTDRISIFLSINAQTLTEYFNVHDPTPIYKRQLSHYFDEYIMSSVVHAKRHTAIFYKFKCLNEVDKQYTEPLIYAIRRHFEDRRVQRLKEFKRFKHSSWLLLGISITIGIIVHGVVPLILNEEHHLQSGLKNGLDVFSWVILWRPIDQLLFYWNPHLKDINLLDKLAKAEAIIVDNEK